MQEMRIVYEGGEGEIEEKKSRFIATVRPVHTEEEALSFVAAMKKKYWNASHNCYAYVIGDRQNLQRCSDDGEPQGTAGRPMLDVLLGEHVSDVVCVVTRYFGGTLLGTGGLVRAYSKAVQEGLRASRVLTRKQGFRFKIRTNYTDLGKLQYLLGQRGIPIMDSIYAEDVRTEVIAAQEDRDELLSAVTEATGGRAQYLDMEDVFYAEGEKLPILLEQDPAREKTE